MIYKMLVNLFQVTIIALFVSCEKPQPPTPLPPSKPPVSISGVARGFTLDSVENLPAIIKAIKAMPFKPWVRIVFDYPEQPSAYMEAVEQISKVAEIVGQPSDSVYSGKMNVAQFRDRFHAYVKAFPQINIWETTNEANVCDNCNPESRTKLITAQADEALKIVKAYGKKSMFVPYWNTPTCADKNGDYYAWTVKNISTYVKSETDYVAISIYGFDCDGGEPNYNTLDVELGKFASIFPKAIVMVGEYGKQGSASVARHYLGYGKVGFGGYWHGCQDLLNTNGAVFKEFIK